MHNQLCNEILINKGDHCSHQCQFPHWGLAHEDYFCAQTFGIFEYSRILYFCSIRNTNTLFCVHLKYEYIFMRHPGAGGDGIGFLVGELITWCWWSSGWFRSLGWFQCACRAVCGGARRFIPFGAGGRGGWCRRSIIIIIICCRQQQ